jgi:leucyl-tRNA synthetase
MLDLLRLLAPFAPHIAEELWARLGESRPVMTTGWPSFDPAKLVASTLTMVIQVNGKHRGDITCEIDTPEAEMVALAAANPKVAPHLADKPIKRIIHIKGRLINLLV